MGLIPVLPAAMHLDVSCTKQRAEERQGAGGKGQGKNQDVPAYFVLKEPHPEPTTTPTWLIPLINLPAGCPLINPWVEKGAGSEVKDAIEDPKDKCCQAQISAKRTQTED